MIRTAHGRGYRFVADVADLEPGARIQHNVAVPADQDIRFCRAADGVRLGYATVGDGPTLVKAANWLSHLDYDWESPVWRHWWQELTQRYQLLRYDDRGCGVSDWAADGYDLDTWVGDLATVVDAANSSGSRCSVSPGAGRSRSRTQRRIPSGSRASCSTARSCSAVGCARAHEHDRRGRQSRRP